MVYMAGQARWQAFGYPNKKTFDVAEELRGLNLQPVMWKRIRDYYRNAMAPKCPTYWHLIKWLGLVDLKTSNGVRFADNDLDEHTLNDLVAWYYNYEERTHINELRGLEEPSTGNEEWYKVPFIEMFED